MGEYVGEDSLVQMTVKQKVKAAGALAKVGLDVHISVDPTQIGFMIDSEMGLENAIRIAHEIDQASKTKSQPGHDVLMLDMEDYSYVDPTLSLYHNLIEQNLPTAITIIDYKKGLTYFEM